MSDYVFLFDLDSTITEVEILPTIAERVGCGERMRELTERSMYEAIPFRTSFLSRVDLLKGVPISTISDEIANIARMLEGAFGKGVSIVVEESGREDIDAVESADEAGYDDFDDYDGEEDFSEDDD